MSKFWWIDGKLEGNFSGFIKNIFSCFQDEQKFYGFDSSLTQIYHMTLLELLCLIPVWTLKFTY